MQGRKDQGRGPWERGTNSNQDSQNGTGKQRTIPQRPPGYARVDTPPAVPRVNRPQRKTKPPRSLRKRLLIFVGVLALLGILTFVIVYGVTNFFIATGSSAGAANTAADFLSNLQSQNYGQAYKDLDASITVQLQPQEFQQMAAADDRCYGPVTDYNEVQGSAKTSADGNTQMYIYSITRSKLSKPYQMTLTIQKDSDGSWDITSYGNDLGPAPPPASCK